MSPLLFTIKSSRRQSMGRPPDLVRSWTRRVRIAADAGATDGHKRCQRRAIVAAATCRL